MLSSRLLRGLRIAALPLAVIVAAACGDDDPTTPEITDDIVDIVVGTADVSTLEAAVVQAELVAALQGDGPFTVFAPDNDAFAALPDGVVDALLEPENADLLVSVLGFHVVPGVEAFSSDLTDGQTVTTLQGDDLTIGVSGSTVTVNGATVTTPDIEATNGVIHLIDEVLVPEADLVDTGILNGFLTLVGLVRDAGLESTLRGDNGGDGYTVFAPTEAAFAALSAVPTGQDLINILLYHVVADTVQESQLMDGASVPTAYAGNSFTVNISGSTVTITDGAGNTVGVVLTDVEATNGVVHVIDGVLLPS